MNIKEKAVDCRKSGMSIKEICNVVNRSERTVLRWLKEAGLTNLGRSDISDYDVMDMYHEGYTIVEIAKHFECSHETITKRLALFGIFCSRDEGIKRHFARVHNDMWDEIKAVLDSGVSVYDTSRKFHMRYNNVYRLMILHNYSYDYPDNIDEILNQTVDAVECPVDRSMGFDEFVRRAIAVHGDEYDYSHVVYKNTKTSVKIICPVHGEFEQTPEKHLLGHGCPDKFCRQLHSEATFMERYGVKHPLQSPDVMEHFVDTSLSVYGTENPMQSNEVQAELTATNMNKYGVPYSCMADDVIAKRAVTNGERYGGLSPFCSKEVRDKAIDTIIRLYGVDNVMKDFDIRTHFEEICLENHGCRYPMGDDAVVSKLIMTNNERYGGASPLCSDEVKQKSRDTCKEKYGTEYYMQCDTAKARIIETKRMNGTFNTSKPEEALYDILRGLYGDDDIFRQYRSLQYPWACDFYIKSHDSYIELNASWTHGKHWYDANCVSDVDRAYFWKNKGADNAYYLSALRTWTDLDVRKRRTAALSGLNYIVFWENDLSDVKRWVAAGCPDSRDYEREYFWEKK